MKTEIALKFIKKTDVYLEKVGVEEIDRIDTFEMPKEVISDISKEFLVILVESANTPKLKELYDALLDDEIHRGNSRTTARDILEIAQLSYEFLSNHWGEISFVLAMLERKGKLDKLKENKKIKMILDTFFVKENAPAKKDKDD